MAMDPEALARDAVRLIDRLERQQIARVQQHLERVQRTLIAELDALDLTDQTTRRVVREARARQLVASSQAAQELLALGRADGPLAGMMREHIAAAFDDGIRSAREAAIAAGILTPAEAAAAIGPLGPALRLDVIEAITRSTLTTIDRLARQGLDRIENAVVQGATRGAGPRATARLVRDAISVTRSDAERITRTVLMRAENDAREQTFREEGVEYLRYDATNDARTCEYCAARHGMVYAVDDAPEVPTHPNCRCLLTAWSPDRSEEDRADEYYERTRREMRDRRREEGERVTTATARAPFERMNDRDAPRPTWAPGRGWL